MPIIATTFLLFLLTVTVMWHQAILLRELNHLYAKAEHCPTQIWRYSENSPEKCLPPRTDHGYLDKKKWRAAGAICWFVRHSSLPTDTVFHPDLADPAKGYRCDFP
jgi:hypothetical protein